MVRMIHLIVIISRHFPRACGGCTASRLRVSSTCKRGEIECQMKYLQGLLISSLPPGFGIPLTVLGPGIRDPGRGIPVFAD